MSSPIKILVSIGGGPEAYAALAFAALLSRSRCTNTALLTIREPDSGLNSGGLELRVAREQILGWGLELPGLRRLKKARDIFADLGEIPGDGPEEWVHRNISGDPAGEYIISYNTPCGGTVALHLRTGTDIPGVLAETCEDEAVTVAIVGGPGKTPTGLKRLMQGRPLAYRIADRVECSVIIARNLEADLGILAVLDGSEKSARRLSLLSMLASSCCTPLSVASTAGPDIIEKARRMLPLNAPPIQQTLSISADADAIIEAGRQFSLLAIPAPEGRLRGTTAERIMEKALNSVMIVR